MSATVTKPTVKTIPIFSGGKWVDARAKRTAEVFNPSTGAVIAKVPLCDAKQTGEVIATADAALAAWAETPVVERARLMFRYRALLGRAFRGARGDCHARAWQDAGRGPGRGKSRHRSRRVRLRHPEPDHGRDLAEHRGRRRCGSGAAPGWRVRRHHAVQLSVHGAAVDVSDRAHLRQHVCAEAVGKGAAVVAATGRAAGRGRRCRTACSTSSTATRNASTRCSIIRRWPRSRSSVRPPIAKYIYERGTAAGKRVQSAGGAKNHLIIMPDADMDQTVKALAASAYGCAGQRCMAGSVAVAVGKAGDPVVDGLVDYVGKFRVGPTDGNEGVDMGPVIRAEHRDKVASYLDIAKQDGADVALDGRREV